MGISNIQTVSRSLWRYAWPRFRLPLTSGTLFLGPANEVTNKKATQLCPGRLSLIETPRPLAFFLHQLDLTVPTTNHQVTMASAITASIAKLSKVQIATFFSNNAPATQKLCDQEAERLMDMPVHPASVQGGTSYAVVSDDGTCVVQFRSGCFALDVCSQVQVRRASNSCHVTSLLPTLTGSTSTRWGMWVESRHILPVPSCTRTTSAFGERFQTLPGTSSPPPTSTRVKGFAQLTLPTQVFRLGMA